MLADVNTLVDLYDQYEVLIDKLLAGEPPTVPPNPLTATLQAPGVVRLSWVGLTPTVLGRVGPPVYGGTLGWDTSLDGGTVTAEILAQGFIDFAEAKPGVAWTLFAVVADGTRYKVGFTPPLA